MARTPDTISTLRDVLTRCRTLAVVGLSPQWHRPSYFAAKYMQAHGYRVIPVNPLVAREGGSILGERAYASVQEADAAVRAEGGRIDLVDCFRKSEDIPPLAVDAVAIGARCLCGCSWASRTKPPPTWPKPRHDHGRRDRRRRALPLGQRPIP